MARVRLVLLVVLVLSTTTACPWGTLRIPSQAIKDFRVATQLAVPDTIELGDDQVRLLASQAGVGDEVIRDVAPSLDAQPTWKSAITRLREVYDDVPDEIRSGSIEIVCDFLQEEITSYEEFVAALGEAFEPHLEPEWAAISQSLVGYAEDMDNALAAGDERAASVALSCYIADQAV